MPSSVRITIIDDDEFVREAVERLIRSLGYDAETFASAEDFLNQSNVADTQCLITDVHMSGLTGVELQTHLVAAGYRIPIIFMSGYSEDAVRATAIRNGAVGFLNKPIRVADLIECLNKALKP